MESTVNSDALCTSKELQGRSLNAPIIETPMIETEGEKYAVTMI